MMAKKVRKYARPASSYNRFPGHRASRDCLLIVCEGRETEPNYFNALRIDLRLSTVDVQIEGEGGTPISVIRKAISVVEKRQKLHNQDGTPIYDQVWCVFDVENPVDNPSFPQAVNQAKARNYCLAISNPAFEYWYLLHFEETNRPFMNASEVIRQLCNYMKGYEKCSDCYDQLKSLTSIAIDRADRIHRNHPDSGESEFPNSSTTVYVLVRCLIEMANRR
jgi:hypothetical protein